MGISIPGNVVLVLTSILKCVLTELVSQNFLNIFKDTKLTNLEVSTSDHCPIWLELQTASRTVCTKAFRFENAWLREPMCYQLVKDVWENNSDASFYNKLSQCSEVLSVWEKEITRNFNRRINRSKKILSTLKRRRDDSS